MPIPCYKTSYNSFKNDVYLDEILNLHSFPPLLTQNEKEISWILSVVAFATTILKKRNEWK